MSGVIDVAIVGAGPYGLSLATHLDAAGVDYRIFGVPMEAWQRHMPPGMFLKSYGESSNLFDPQMSFSLEDYSRQNGLEYHPIQLPVRLETFISYGRTFQERFKIRTEPKRLVEMNATGRGYELDFDNGETVNAKRVVLAIGVQPYKYTPPKLAHLPDALISHSSDYGSLERLAGREVTIVGAGASAYDIAALLGERGAKVTIIARDPEPHFQNPPDPDPSLLHQLLFPSANGLGGGWLLRLCGDAPQLIHLLPDYLRLSILKNTLGPSGGYFVRDQILGKVTMKLACSVTGAEECGGRVRVTVVGRNGTGETVESDHVIAATGYRVDVRRLNFLRDGVLRQIRTVDNTPILSANFESTAPGVHFVGLSSARSFGPVMRFVVGAVHPARRLSKILPKSLLRRPVPVSAAYPS